MACPRKLKKKGYTRNKETKMCANSKASLKTSVNKTILKKKNIRRITGTFKNKQKNDKIKDQRNV